MDANIYTEIFLSSFARFWIVFHTDYADICKNERTIKRGDDESCQPER